MLVQRLLFILLLLALCSCSDIMAQQVLRTQKQTGELDGALFTLVTASGTSYSPSDIEVAVRSIACPGASPPLVVFVHGMGDYPGKAFKERTLEKIETLYDVQVIMFHWPSWIDFRTIPRENAAVSGKKLTGLFQHLDRARRQRDAPLSRMRRVLLVHSLGCEVLKGSLSEYPGGLPRDLFDAVIIVAPEVDLRGHAVWLEKLDFSRSIAVLLNSRDHVLVQVRSHLKEERLGLGLVNLDGSEEPLAENTSYIITDNGSDWHRFYVERQSPGLERLFKGLVQGTNEPIRSRELETVKQPNVFSLKPEIR